MKWLVGWPQISLIIEGKKDGWLDVIPFTDIPPMSNPNPEPSTATVL